MSLIDKLLDGAEDIIKAAKKPFIKKKITRVFESALDNIEEKKLNAELEIQSLRKKLVENPEKAENYLNCIIDERTKIHRAEITKEVVEKEKQEWFGEE